LSLQAYRRDRWFVITVSDDGKGIDYDKVLSRAIDQQLLKPEDAANLSETRLLECIFEPGFTTASRLSDLSGRGIGLDVVKNQIEALQGRITLQSRPYHGTTFSLYLPYEINVAKVVICRVQSHLYAFLSESIQQVVIPSPGQIENQPDGRLLQPLYREHGQAIPIRDLAEQLPYTLARSDQPLDFDQSNKPLLIFRQDTQSVALEVDEVVGEEEVVIRPIQNLIPLPPSVIGCCVLSNGHLTLLLDGTAFLAQAPDFISFRTRLTPIPQVDRPTEATVLIVDDSVTLRQNLALTLQKAGYSVIQASDGQQAIAQLQQYRHTGLVICDVEMPQMNGFEFLSRRSQDTAFAAIPVIMLTSRTGDKHRKIALDLGANGYLGKPYLDQELLDTITPFLPSPIRSQAQPLITSAY
jgi:two-component system, chemotaxis family, sensor histidine kinase and response regulator PixL